MNIVPIVSKLNGETKTTIKNSKRNINHSFINFLLSFPHSHLEDLSISFKLYDIYQFKKNIIKFHLIIYFYYKFIIL